MFIPKWQSKPKINFGIPKKLFFYSNWAYICKRAESNFHKNDSWKSMVIQKRSSLLPSSLYILPVYLLHDIGSVKTWSVIINFVEPITKFKLVPKMRKQKDYYLCSKHSQLCFISFLFLELIFLISKVRYRSYFLQMLIEGVFGIRQLPNYC